MGTGKGHGAGFAEVHTAVEVDIAAQTDMALVMTVEHRACQRKMDYLGSMAIEMDRFEAAIDCWNIEVKGSEQDRQSSPALDDVWETNPWLIEFRNGSKGKGRDVESLYQSTIFIVESYTHVVVFLIYIFHTNLVGRRSRCGLLWFDQQAEA